MLLLAFALAAPLTTPPPSRAQGVDVYINITSGGTKKLNIAIPEFTVTTGADPAATGKLLASIAGADLTFSGLFSVVAATGAIPADNAAALKQSWTDFAAAGAHAGVHGLLALRGSRISPSMRDPRRASSPWTDRKSTRLNSSHVRISYAVFCLKSKKNTSELQSRPHLVCRLLLATNSAKYILR